jgi:translation initiation factor 1 (eIF-1/SUI1)
VIERDAPVPRFALLEKGLAMGIFSSILDRLRHHSSPAASGGQASAPQQAQYSAPQTSQQGSPAPIQNVDVDAVLKQLASKKGGGGNYQTSIVDLLKLLDLDSSLAARKELATELNVRVGADGTAEQNIALQKAVMRKLAENGGKVPDSLKD